MLAPMQGFREVDAGGIRLHVTEDLPADWAVGLWQDVRRQRTDEIQERPLPPVLAGRFAMVKLYPARNRHRILRRLRRGRAAREGRGYAEFAARGIPTPRLLLWGEKRRFGLHVMGIVATVRIYAPPVARAYRQTGEEEILAAAIEELAFIHRAGLVHGDALARNFLATRPRVTVFDLASWGRLRPASRIEDLSRFLGTAACLSGGTEICHRLLERYWSALGEMPVTIYELLPRVEAFVAARRESER
ncbi:MAG: BUD32 family EKC/KEOPS complex subunit [Planctomycetota bacterium]|jgi:tRNA A-37 threonylcarbamoyl transferase component Bud32